MRAYFTVGFRLLLLNVSLEVSQSFTANRLQGKLNGVSDDLIRRLLTFVRRLLHQRNKIRAEMKLKFL